MGDFAPIKPSGLRRYSQFNAVVARIAKGYEAKSDVSPARLLNKLKRAAPYMGLPRSAIALLDVLVAYTKPQDWRPGQMPCVWPRNETLSQKLGVSVRQVQNYIRAAVELGLIIPHDSPNGHRGGLRGKEGQILWGYGFDLSPLAVRGEEFEGIAAKGEAEDREITRLRKVIGSCRRRARVLAEAVELHELDLDAERELDLVRMAVAHVSGSRDIDSLVKCVAQLTARLEGFQGKVDAAFGAKAKAPKAQNTSLEPVDISPKGEADCVDSTTTTQLQSAYAVTSNGFARRSSEKWDIARLAPKSAVEDELEKHNIGPNTIAKACPQLIWDLEPGPRAWGRLVSIAEGLVGTYSISLHAWREACRIMGEKGAAAAVIATVSKTISGEVRSPGAYLRGMSEKALSGSLHLAKTYHGLLEAASEPA